MHLSKKSIKDHLELFNNSKSSRELEKIIQIEPLFFLHSRAMVEKKGDELDDFINSKAIWEFLNNFLK